MHGYLLEKDNEELLLDLADIEADLMTLNEMVWIRLPVHSPPSARHQSVPVLLTVIVCTVLLGKLSFHRESKPSI